MGFWSGFWFKWPFGLSFRGCGRSLGSGRLRYGHRNGIETLWPRFREASRSHASDSPSPGECRDRTNGPARRRRCQEFVFNKADAFFKGVPGGAFFAQEECQFLELGFECSEGAFAILEARVEFAFAQGEYVGADFEVLFCRERAAGVSGEFLRGASSGLVERLHPESFRHMRDRFR